MSFRGVRFYSAGSLGRLSLTENSVEVIGPAVLNPLEQFTAQKGASRNSALKKLEAAFLYDQLNRGDRRLVFRYRDYMSEDTEKVRGYPMMLGSRKTRVKLTPRKYELVSAKDLRTIVYTGQSKDEVQASIDYILQAVRTPATKDVVTPDLLTVVMKRAAAAGYYDEAYRQLSGNLKDLGEFLTPKFYADCLKLYALRLPFLSVHGAQRLHTLYSKAQAAGPAADLAYVYGLVVVAQKAGLDKAKQLPEVLGRVTQYLDSVKDHPRRSLKQMEVSDYVLGYEAAKLAKELPDAADLANLEPELAQFLAKLQKDDRPPTVSLVVEIPAETATENE